MGYSLEVGNRPMSISLNEEEEEEEEKRGGGGGEGEQGGLTT
jgi:hypothetical protein